VDLSSYAELAVRLVNTAGLGHEGGDHLTSLIQYPVHPQLSGHDGQAWHVHYTESGSMSDKYAAGAAMGLAVRLADLGIDRFGVCQAAPCQGVFVDTSVNRTRRYCSDRCASRANVTAYRARKRGEDI
jgi:predicted RNA-binding Zn ribbon-like protein